MRMVPGLRRPNGSPSVSSEKAGASGSHCRPTLILISRICLQPKARQQPDGSLGRSRISAPLARSGAPPIIDAPAQCSIEDTKKLYPLPRLENLSLEYRTGERRIGPTLQTRRQGQARPRPLGDGRDAVRAGGPPPLHGSRRGVRLARPCRSDGCARARRRFLPCFVSAGRRERNQRRIVRAGLRTESDGDSLAVQILKAADPDDEILVVSRPGWHRVEPRTIRCS